MTRTNPQQTAAQRLVGDFAPKLAELTDDVLFGDVWARPGLSPRDRSLITCAALVTSGSTEQLRSHLAIGKQNGLTDTELKEAIIHLAFHAGWPRAMSAITDAKEILGTSNPWFRRAKASGTGRVRAAGVERDVTFTAP
ncbi:MAG TPA: carboxymuconolactone decarboxylase family protein, partial [Streptosporangiaceae bacterium]|nr:carboxymuconolactone decarboxylase family protein [Streptosporangiaceae bacterium]